VDDKRCSLPYCDWSDEYKNKFSRKIDVECHFHTPVEISPMIIFGHSPKEHFHELCEQIAAMKVICCLVELKGSQDEWDYPKDMMHVASEMYEESTYGDSIFYNVIIPKVAFMGKGEHGSHALLTIQMSQRYPEYVDNRFTYGGYIVLSPSMKVKGVLEGLRPQYERADIPLGLTPGYGHLLIFAASADCVDENKSNAVPIFGQVNGCKTYVELQGGSHCFYAQNASHVVEEEGYRGFRTESAFEEREACLLRENECLSRDRAIEAPGSDRIISMDPGLQKQIIRDIISPWVRWVCLDENSSFTVFKQAILQHATDNVWYNQRSCEFSYGGNLP